MKVNKHNVILKKQTFDESECMSAQTFYKNMCWRLYFIIACIMHFYIFTLLPCVDLNFRFRCFSCQTKNPSKE